jgi:hypothetical protein
VAVERFLPCAVLLPSLGRPHRLEGAASNIHLNTDLDHEILWCVGGIHSRQILDGLGERYLDDTDDEDKRYVTRMNKLIVWAKEEGFKSAFFGSDDVIHHDGWLTEALTRMEALEKSVIVVNDLRNPNGTQAVVRLDYQPFLVFDDEDAAFHPGYHHNFADTEMFLTAAKYKQLGRAMESRVEHLHPIYQNQTSRPWDDTYRNAFTHWEADGKLFHERVAALEAEDMSLTTHKVSAIEFLWDDGE